MGIISRFQAIVIVSWLALPLAAIGTTTSDTCSGLGGTFTAGANGAPGKCVVPGSPGIESLGTKVAGILIFLVAAISVIMIIIGGLRYALSGGDAAGVKNAKNTILYALVGVVVAALAYAAVKFLVGRLV